MKKFKLGFLICLIYLLSIELVARDYFQDYSRIDAHALKTPNYVETNIPELAKYLVKPANNDREKIRALFRWVTENINYDVKSYMARAHKHLSPEQVLSSKTAVCDGYAGLLVELGQAVGVDIVKVIGYSKGYDYSVGQRFRDGPNHAWNAAKIDGQWQLFDPTWGAGYTGENNQFIRQFQEIYFLAPPEQFLYDHLPEDQRWQLVSRPISLREFEDLPYLRSAFFNHGLNLKSHHQNLIRAGDETEVTFYSPDNIALVAQLFQRNKPIEDYFCFAQRKSGQYSILANFPKEGSYILRLYAKNSSQPGDYEWAADY